MNPSHQQLSPQLQHLQFQAKMLYRLTNSPDVRSLPGVLETREGIRELLHALQGREYLLVRKPPEQMEMFSPFQVKKAPLPGLF